MKISALLTSAGINIGLCALFLSLYSVLRKQPANARVYFGPRVAEEKERLRGAFVLKRFVPSTGWIVKALQCTEEEILSAAGFDAVVFNRILVFSIRIFSLAAVLCTFALLPINYFGQDIKHVRIPSETLNRFTIGNVEMRSRWLWVHCVALYIISGVACILLYIEYKHIARLRLLHLTSATPNPNHFTVLVHGIPKITKESYSDVVHDFFTKYLLHLHQVVYKVRKVQKIMNGTKKAYRKFKHFTDKNVYQRCRSITYRCLCGASSNSFKSSNTECEQNRPKPDYESSLELDEEECTTALAVFKSRYAALVASKLLESTNHTKWVANLASEPEDFYWSNLLSPKKHLWVGRIASRLGSIVLMFLFLVPLTFIQGLSQLEQLQLSFPFLRGILNKKYYMMQLATGYLPSVIQQIFLYVVPPIMMVLSTLEGPTSCSKRKRIACCKVLNFTIWNIFFVNVLSGMFLRQLSVLPSPMDIAMQLARAIAGQSTFFITYVLTSGWASLSSELMQLFGLIKHIIRKYVLRMREDTESIPSFPYHTEVPKVLFFGLLGFTFSVLSPLILPFLLVYFFLGYVVYRNQLLYVYRTTYDTGGLYWPVAHNTVIFSLVLAQVTAFGVFSLKKSPVAAGFTVPLIILTLLFNQYCRFRLLPLFWTFPEQALIDMDREDERSGRMDEIHHRLHSAYCKFPNTKEVPLEKI